MSDLMLHGILRMPPELWADDPISVIQRTSTYVAASDTITSQQARIAELEQRIHEACEVYAGMEGVIPVHAETGYVLRTINQMYKALLESSDELE